MARLRRSATQYADVHFQLIAVDILVDGFSLFPIWGTNDARRQSQPLLWPVERRGTAD